MVLSRASSADDRWARLSFLTRDYAASVGEKRARGRDDKLEAGLMFAELSREGKTGL